MPMEFKKVMDYVEKHKESHFKDIFKKNLEITSKKSDKDKGGLDGDKEN